MALNGRARSSDGRVQSFEDLGVLPHGLCDEIAQPKNQDGATLYIFEVASPNRGRLYHKVGTTVDLRVRATDIRSTLARAGRYKNFTVLLKAAFPKEGQHEAAVLQELRGCLAHLSIPSLALEKA